MAKEPEVKEEKPIPKLVTNTLQATLRCERCGFADSTPIYYEKGGRLSIHEPGLDWEAARKHTHMSKVYSLNGYIQMCRECTEKHEKLHKEFMGNES